MIYYIKYMVSHRCQMKVREEFAKLGLHPVTVSLGEVEINEIIATKQLKQLREGLLKAKLELMDNKSAILIQKIKNVIIDMVHYSDQFPKSLFSEFIADKLHYNYTYLANLFSEAEGTTIEQFTIVHKIEKVKELIMYDELSLTEIAYKLNYSSIGHLSNQFKKVTGLTPSAFRAFKNKNRTRLEDI